MSDISPKGDLLTGRTLADFHVEAMIGQGGFGAVYRARQRVLDREAVIKVLHADHQKHPDATTRFLREARLASQLDHPFAAHLYAFGAEPDGLLWIAMELVRGTSLSDLLKTQGAMPLARFVPLLERICEVVQAAHDKGIVHRDLKPANVMVLSRSGRLSPKLLDFGVAKLRAEPNAAPAVADAPEEDATEGDFWKNLPHELVQATSVQLTQQGAVVGSPHYMAPEQWANARVPDARTDIYALGVLSFQCLSGQVPFDGPTLQAIAQAHGRGVLPPLPPELPAALHAVLAKACAKRAKERYPSAVEFAAAVRAASGLEDEPTLLPRLDEELRELFISQAPQPLAEAVAALDAARNARQGVEAVVQLVRSVTRYLGVVALACRARVGPGSRSDSPSARELLARLGGEGLTDAGWWDLARELSRGFVTQRDAYPVPELVGAFHDPGDNLEPLTRPWARLEDNEVQLLTAFTSILPQLERGLRALAWTVEYPLRVGRGTTAERWMGARRGLHVSAPSPASVLASGEVALFNRDGSLAVSLQPLAQVIAPTPAAADELFLFEGPGRHGAKLVSRPLEFERHDEAFWSWFSSRIADVGAGKTGGGAEERAPFRGLASFTKDDAEHFFGREREAEAFLNRLRTHPLLAVVGPSGSGKSSFVQAGVLPSLPATWRSLVTRPGATPLALLATRLGAAGADVTGLREQVLRRPAVLGERLKALTQGEAGFVLVVDQFEELLTLCHDPEERNAFAEALVAAASLEDRIRVVITLRDDFVIRVQRLPALRERLAPGLQLLATPAPDELLRILVEPARRAGYAFEDDALPKQMVEAVSEQSGALALLSFTAMKLWELRDRAVHRLTRKAYQALGGVGGALAHHAETTLGAMPPAEHRLVREAFRALVTAEGTRAILSRVELQQLLGGGAAAEAALERLINARLLVASEGVGGEDRIEVIHETLLSSWPRLVAWQREDAESARLRDQLRAAARQWQERGRSRGVLWRGEALMEYRLWRRRYAGALTDTEQAFAQASLRDDTRGRRLRLGALVVVLLGLSAGLVVLFRANRAAQLSRQEAHDRLAALHVEQGRLEWLAGRPLQGLLYLSQAYGEGVRGPAIEYLLARGSEATQLELAALEGHTRRISWSEISPNGDLAATASADGTARLWRLPGGEPVAVLKGHVGWVMRAIFSRDGTRLATGGNDRVIRLWEVPSGKLLRTLEGHTAEVIDLAISPDGKQIASGSTDGTVRLWSAVTGAQERVMTPDPKGIGRMVYSPDGHLIAGMSGFFATSTTLPVVHVWDAHTGQRIKQFTGHRLGVWDGTFTPDGKVFISASEDGSLRSWDVASGRTLHTFLGHRAPVVRLALSADGKQVLSASEDDSARLWDVGTGETRFELPSREGAIRGVAFSPDGLRLATAGEDAILRTWDARNGRPLMTYSGHGARIGNVSYSPNGQWILTSGTDLEAKLWNARATRYAADISSHDPTSSVELDASGKRLLTVTADPLGFFRTQDARTGKLIDQVDFRSIDSSAWRADGTRVLGTRPAPDPSSTSPEIVEFPSGHTHCRLVGHTAPVTAASFSPDGKHVVTADTTRMITMWDSDTCRAETSFRAHDDQVMGLNFSPDGLRLLSSSADQTVKVWDLTGRPLFTLEGHQLSVVAAAQSPDGRWIATASGDQTVGVWDARTGALISRLQGQHGFINDVLYSHDSAFLLSSSVDGSAFLWDATSGSLLDRFEIGEQMFGFGFTADNRQIMTAGSRGTILLWNINRNARTAEQLTRLVRCRVPFVLDGERVLPRHPEACTGL